MVTIQEIVASNVSKNIVIKSGIKKLSKIKQIEDSYLLDYGCGIGHSVEFFN